MVASTSPRSMDTSMTDPDLQGVIAPFDFDSGDGNSSAHSDYHESLDVTQKAVCEWRVENFKSLIDNKKASLNGPQFSLLGHLWSILLFPAGNGTSQGPPYVSAYVKIVDPPLTPDSWNITLRHRLTVVNHQKKNNTNFKHRTSFCGLNGDTFSKEHTDWGFNLLLDHRELTESSGFLDEEGALVIRATLIPVRPAHGPPTGKVGLENHGATCYLNSLLQTLFMTKRLRLAVYELDSANDVSKKAVSLELQRLFWQLEHSDQAVPTRDLTIAFGWTNQLLYNQHDVQEMNRELIDKLEERMADTPQADIIKRLYTGKMRSFIKCINVDFESSRDETYYDIQLDVKDIRNVYESFSKYTELEKLEGDNQYDAESFGKQDANKGVSFLSFPPVLNLHLKRFEYDMVTGSTNKLNTRYSFPSRLNLDKFLDPSVQIESTPHYNYVLHAVLVHSGEVDMGHYSAYINDMCKRSSYETNWLKFDDTRVSFVNKRQAVNSNYGKDDGMSSSSAYMLVYILESELDFVLVDVPRVPPELVSRFESEAELQVKRVLDEEKKKNSIQIRYVTIQDINMFYGYGAKSPNRHEDFATASMYHTLSIHKQDSVIDFYHAVAGVLGVDTKLIRIWHIVDRENHTTRPHDLFKPLKDLSLKEVIGQDEPTVFVDVVDDVDNEMTPSVKRKLEDSFGWMSTYDDSCLLFFRQFHPLASTEESKITNLGCLTVDSNAPVNTLASLVETAFGTDSDLTRYKFWEMTKVTKLQFLDHHKRISDYELVSGDIIVFTIEESAAAESVPSLDIKSEIYNQQPPCKFKTPSDYFSHLYFRSNVVLLPFYAGDTSEGVLVEMRSSDKYHDIFNTVCRVLCEITNQPIEVLHSRTCLYTSRNTFTTVQDARPLQRLTGKTDITLSKLGRHDKVVVFYEVLPCSLSQASQAFEVQLQEKGYSSRITKKIFYVPDDKLGSLAEAVAPGKSIRWLIVKDNAVHDIIAADADPRPSSVFLGLDKLRELESSTSLFSEYRLVADIDRIFPCKVMNTTTRLVPVYHFHSQFEVSRQQAKLFGMPFVVVCDVDDSAQDVLKSIAKQLRLPEDVCPWKLACFQSVDEQDIRWTWVEESLGDLFSNGKAAFGVFHANLEKKNPSKTSRGMSRAPMIASSGIER